MSELNYVPLIAFNRVTKELETVALMGIQLDVIDGVGLCESVTSEHKSIGYMPTQSQRDFHADSID